MLLTQLVPDLLLLLLDDDLLPDLLGLLFVSPDHLTLYTLLLSVPIEELPAERVHLETRLKYYQYDGIIHDNNVLTW